MTAETLDALLDQAGRPIGQVAKSSGMTLRALLDLRRGNVASPRVTTVAGLALALCVDPQRVRAAIAASRAAAGSRRVI